MTFSNGNLILIEKEYERYKLNQQEAYYYTFKKDPEFFLLTQKQLMKKYGVTNNIISKYQHLIRNNDPEEIFNTLYKRELEVSKTRHIGK